MHRGTQPTHTPDGPPHQAREGAHRCAGRRRAGRPPASTRPVREVVVALVGLGIAAAGVTLFVAIVRQAPALPGPARPDDVLLGLLGWVGLLLAAWLALGSLLAVATLLPGAAGRLAAEIGERITPAAVRKVLALALGASVGSLALPPALVSVAGSGPVTLTTGGRALGPDAASSSPAPGFRPTEATPGFAPTPDRAPHAVSSAPRPAALPAAPDGPGFSPTRPAADSMTHSDTPVSSPSPGPGYVPTTPPPVHDADRPRLLAPPPRQTTAAHDLVAVRRGDSLWSIAARHLGPGSTDAEIAWEWPRWYAANRDVVGHDPDVLVPGQLLRPPPPPSSPTSRPSTPHRFAEAGADPSAQAPQGVQR